MKLTNKINELLCIKTDIEDILFSKKALKKHMLKRNHHDALKYLDNLDEIIESPDYVGVNPREQAISVEYVKCYENNVLVAIKINIDNNNFYVASLYTIDEYKLNKHIRIKRLKKFDKNE